MPNLKSLLAAAASASMIGATLPALSMGQADERGFDVAAQSDRSDRGYQDSRVEMEMIMRNAAGAETRRTLELTTLELPDESIGDRSLIVFDSPADIDGTALLSHAQILDADNQWLFLPALGRVRRISSANKSGPFVGSEFAFEDITGQELNKFAYEWVREESCGELLCDVVERTPRYENSGYARQLVWIDQEHHQFRKIEYFNRRDAHIKTQVFEDYRLYNGGIWRAHRWVMENHQSRKSTELVFSEFTFGIGLDEQDFERAVLRRVR